MTLPHWLQITYDCAQIATPLVALFGFIFVYKQIAIARKQSEVMNQQLELALAARKVENTPYFALHVPTSSNDATWVKYDFVLTNVGLAAAFQFKINYIQNEIEDVSTNIEFAAVTVGSEAKFSLKFTTDSLMNSVKLYVRYRNIYGDVFHQSLQRKSGVFEAADPPTIIAGYSEG